MTCTRCHGLLIEIPPLVWSSGDDYHATQSDRCGGEAWQCLNCGNYVDGVILANRLSPPLAEVAAVSVQCLTQPTTFGKGEGMRSPVSDLTDRTSGFFPSEIEWSV